MAADLKEAIENLQGQANAFRSIFELADLLTPLADAKRAQKEAEAARDLAQAEHKTLCTKTAEERAKAKNIAAGAEEHAAKLKKDAETAAVDQAETIVRQARTEAERLTGEAVATVKSESERAAKAKKAADAAEARTSAAAQELSALEDKIAAARTQIASMLQG